MRLIVTVLEVELKLHVQNLWPTNFKILPKKKKLKIFYAENREHKLIL